MDVAVIAGGLTCILLPLDVIVNKRFKDKISTACAEWMCSNDHCFAKGDRGAQSRRLSSSECLMPGNPSSRDGGTFSPSQTGITNNVDGTEEDLTYHVIRNETRSFCAEFLTTFKNNTVDTNLLAFKSHLQSMLAKHIPSKLRSTCHNILWLTHDLKRQT